MATTKGNTRPALVTDLRKLLTQPNPTIPLYFDSTLEKMTVFKNAVNAYVSELSKLTPAGLTYSDEIVVIGHERSSRNRSPTRKTQVGVEKGKR
jgi:hypothetical protein